MKKLHILSDLATPHNNALIAAMRASGELRVITWYAYRRVAQLPWNEPLGGEVDNHYFDTWKTRWNLIRTLLKNPADEVLLVGYSNPINRIVFLARVLFRRRLMMWSDQPNEKSGLGGWVRQLAYAMVKRRAAPLFVVGQSAIKWFEARGFETDQLVNLPIFIDVPSEERLRKISRRQVREFYGVQRGQILAVAASRLIFEKGYDLLLRSVELLSPSIRQRLRILIVGSGPEKEELDLLRRKLSVADCVQMVEWLSPSDYEDLVGAADFFIHSARFDAYGGGTLFSMAYGVPVIGSTGAGSAVDRIEHGKNGLLYHAENVPELANAITLLCEDCEMRGAMGRNARATAEEWDPAKGARILVTSIMGSDTL